MLLLFNDVFDMIEVCVINEILCVMLVVECVYLVDFEVMCVIVDVLFVLIEYCDIVVLVVLDFKFYFVIFVVLCNCVLVELLCGLYEK